MPNCRSGRWLQQIARFRLVQRDSITAD